jgi:hypothetical protein
LFDQVGQLLLTHAARRLQPEQQGRPQPRPGFRGQPAASQWQAELATLGDLDARLECGRQLRKRAPHLLRRLQVRLGPPLFHGER